MNFLLSTPARVLGGTLQAGKKRKEKNGKGTRANRDFPGKSFPRRAKPRGSSRIFDKRMNDTQLGVRKNCRIKVGVLKARYETARDNREEWPEGTDRQSTIGRERKEGKIETATESSVVYKCIRKHDATRDTIRSGSQNLPLQNANLPAFSSVRLLSFPPFLCPSYLSLSFSHLAFLRGALAPFRFFGCHKHVTIIDVLSAVGIDRGKRFRPIGGFDVEKLPNRTMGL